MTRTLRVTADASTVSMARAIRAASRAAPLFVLSTRALGELADELGGMDAAIGELRAIAEANGRPLGVNLETGPDTSKTAFLAPRGWADERLQGWIAGHHRELEAEFGEVARVGGD